MPSLPIDALSWFERFTARKRNLWFFSLFFLFPLIGNVVSRWAKSGWWLNDFDALICGAHYISTGQSPYSLHPVCEGLRPAVYVYAPQVAQFFIPFIDAFGLSGARMAYLLILLPAMGIMTWYMLFKAFPKSPFHFRLMSVAAINGSAACCGNISFILHALVVLGAINLKRSRWPFIIAVTLGAMVKPVFLTYLVVLLFENRPLVKRLFAGMIAAAVGLGGVMLIMLTSGTFGDAWHEALHTIVIEQQPGISFFALTSSLGFSMASPISLIGLAIFTGVMIISGLILTEWGRLNDDERILLGMGFALMLNPRLQDYDMYFLGPCLAMIIMMVKPLDTRIFIWVSWLFSGILIFDVIINILEVEGIHRAPLTVFIYCVLTVSIAGLTAWPQRARIRGWFRNPVPVLQDILAQRI